MAPASSLTLQCFCTDKSQSVSYKTLRIYLAAIQKALCLVCRVIRHQQSNVECTQLPITINLLRKLKSQLRSLKRSLLDQNLLWAAFSLLFYRFLRASKCLGVIWADILIHNDHVTIILRQSRTNPFKRGQSIHIYPSLMIYILYKVCTVKQPHYFVYSAGTFSPLSCSRLPQKCVSYCLTLTCVQLSTHHI